MSGQIPPRRLHSVAKKISRHGLDVLLLAQHAKRVAAGLRTHVETGGDTDATHFFFGSVLIRLLAWHIEHISVGLRAHAQSRCGGEPNSFENREIMALAQHAETASKILSRVADEWDEDHAFCVDFDTDPIIILIKHAERVSRKLHAHSQKIEDWSNFSENLMSHWVQTDNAWKLMEELSKGLAPVSNTPPLVPQYRGRTLSCHIESVLSCTVRAHRIRFITHKRSAVEKALTTDLVATVHNHCKECKTCKNDFSLLVLRAQRYASEGCDNPEARLTALNSPAQIVDEKPTLIK